MQALISGQSSGKVALGPHFPAGLGMLWKGWRKILGKNMMSGLLSLPYCVKRTTKMLPWVTGRRISITFHLICTFCLGCKTFKLMNKNIKTC